MQKLDKVVLANRLKIARKALKISQEMVGKEIGLTQNAVSKIERGFLRGQVINYIQFLLQNGVSCKYLFEKHIEGEEQTIPIFEKRRKTTKSKK